MPLCVCTVIQITTNRAQAKVASVQHSGGLHAQILYRYCNFDFGHRLLCKCSHEQRRYTSVTRLLCRRVQVISAEPRSRTGLVKMNAPEGAGPTGACSEWNNDPAFDRFPSAGPDPPEREQARESIPNES
jgi:hypothetical protein